MKAIKITADHAPAIEAALLAVNGRSKAHAYTSYDEIAALAAAAEKTLDELLLKRDFPGAVWRETSGSAVANCYRGVRNGTTITIERRSSAWYLVDAHQAPLFKRGGGKGRLTLTVEQDVAAKAKVQSLYSIAKPDEPVA